MYRGNRLLGELLHSFLQRREFDEHAAKTASALAVGVNLAGGQQNEGAWRRGIRTPLAIQVASAINDRAQIQFIVPMARVVHRNRRTTMQFD